MSTITREVGAQTLHDQVVGLVAQRWAQSWHCEISIHTDPERPKWTGSDQCEADIIGWQLKGGKPKIEWVAEIETPESLVEIATIGRWQDDAARGVPFFLFVPKSSREQAQKLAIKAGLTLNGVYQYSFVNGSFQLS